MKSRWRSWLLVALWVCPGGLSCTDAPSKSVPAPAPVTCNLRITGASIQYNGHALSLPGSLKTWEQVLGTSSRKVEAADDVFVWDQLGIHAFARAPGNALRGFFVLLNPRTTPDRPAPTYWPRSPFKGRLCVDGSDITPSSRLEDVNRSKQGQKFSKGYLETIYSYDLLAPVPVYVRLDLSEDGRVESFSMSLTNEVP
jgi:hypothetical protein